MNFFQNISQSIYSPKFYLSIPKKSFGQSFGYFLLLALLLTLIQSISLIKPLIMDTPIAVQNFIQETIQCFPKDLEVKISNGKVSINQQEPYFLYPCGNSAENSAKLLVIDTKTPFSADKYNQYQAAAWITQDSIVYKKDNFETRSYTLSQIQAYKLNQDVLKSYTNIVTPWLKFIGPILMFFAFIGIYLAYNFRLIYILILAIVIWLLAKTFKKALTYGESYKIGLHAVTLGLIVELIINLTNKWTNFYGFPFMFSLLTLGVVIVNYFTKRKSV